MVDRRRRVDYRSTRATMGAPGIVGNVLLQGAAVGCQLLRKATPPTSEKGLGLLISSEISMNKRCTNSIGVIMFILAVVFLLYLLSGLPLSAGSKVPALEEIGTAGPHLQYSLPHTHSVWIPMALVWGTRPRGIGETACMRRRRAEENTKHVSHQRMCE